MTEQERRRRRREMERRTRMRSGQRQKEEKRGGLTSFRIYVTAILAGGLLLISLFHTETSDMVCSRVKETIAAQTDSGKMLEWRERLLAYLQEKEIPVFEEQREEEKDYRPDISP